MDASSTLCGLCLTCLYFVIGQQQWLLTSTALAGLLYSQAKALLALPHAHVLVQRIIGALAINGGQRFAAQAGETAGMGISI